MALSRGWLLCQRCLRVQSNRRFSRSSNFGQWQQLRDLGDTSVENFRQQCFLPTEPATLNGAFREMPAAKKWFSRGAPSDLQLEYLQPHGSTLLPMELTRRTGQQTTFNKANAPLSLFLSWENSSHGADHCRLYIAQAPLASLPEQLQKDVPAPAIVSQAGKGDVYDANLWMGAPPTYTPLHKDPNPNLLVQLAGCKTVRLMSPEEGEAIFASVQEALGRSTPASWRGDEMMQGYEHELLESRIWREALGDEMPDAPAGFEARLEGGDGIFIPRGWWHSIKGTGSGITASVNWWFR